MKELMALNQLNSDTIISSLPDVRLVLISVFSGCDKEWRSLTFPILK